MLNWHAIRLTGMAGSASVLLMGETAMDIVFAILSLVIFVLLIVGLIRPRWAFLRARWQVLLTYPAVLVALGIVSAILMPTDELVAAGSQTTNTAPTSVAAETAQVSLDKPTDPAALPDLNQAQPYTVTSNSDTSFALRSRRQVLITSAEAEAAGPAALAHTALAAATAIQADTGAQYVQVLVRPAPGSVATALNIAEAVYAPDGKDPSGERPLTHDGRSWHAKAIATPTDTMATWLLSEH